MMQLKICVKCFEVSGVYSRKLFAGRMSAIIRKDIKTKSKTKQTTYERKQIDEDD